MQYSEGPFVDVGVTMEVAPKIVLERLVELPKEEEKIIKRRDKGKKEGDERRDERKGKKDKPFENQDPEYSCYMSLVENLVVL